MKNLRLWALGVSLAFCACASEKDKPCMSPPFNQETRADLQVKPLWKAFRERFPYHIQTIGCSTVNSLDSSYVILIAEPTPNTTTEGLDELLTCYRHRFATHTHSIGYDGWVKDISIVIAGISPTELENLKSKISDYIFGSTYGRYFLTLQEHYTTEYAPLLSQNLNYQITPTELDYWFLGDSAVIFDKGVLKEIFKTASVAKSTLHYSRKYGFVAWVLPKKTDISSQLDSIRKFVLDTEMIIGAISNETHVAIIARERRSSVYDLPPLRTETLLLLAAANEKQLSQSYERNHILACKLSNNKDWAPIYLSNELINTEYGSLLNITDQLLKSWSQNGETQYSNFNYPTPKKWGFEQSLATIIAEKFHNGSLTFNWNTTGAVYKLTESSHSIIGLNRTGSLPMSYIPENLKTEQMQKVIPYEQKGYNFFANSHDANLFRAAQYAALYQIFKAEGIRAPNSKILNTHELAINEQHFEALAPFARDFIRKIKNLKNSDIQLLARKMAELELKKIKKNANSEQSLIIQMFGSNLIKQLMPNYSKPLENLCSIARRIPDEDIIALGNSLANPREHGASELIYINFTAFNEAFQKASFLKYHFDLLGMESEKIMKTFCEANQHYTRWIKTPTLVLSTNKNAVEAYGGHSIRPELLDIEASYEIERGKVFIQNGKLKVHPSDKAHLTPDELRALGLKMHQQTGNRVHELLSGGKVPPPKPPRSPETVFADPPEPPSKRGFSDEAHAVLEVAYLGKNLYTSGKKSIKSCSDLVNHLFETVNQQNNAVIEFKYFDANTLDVLIKSLDMKIQVTEHQTTKLSVVGSKTRFVTKNESVLLKFDEKGTGINSTRYTFEKEPILKTGKDKQGRLFTSVELKPKGLFATFFFIIKVKTQKMFNKMSGIFERVYKRSANNGKDFIMEMHKELRAEGFTANDYELILSQTADCYFCQPKIIENYHDETIGYNPQTSSMFAVNRFACYGSRFLSRLSRRKQQRLCEIATKKISFYATCFVGKGSFAVAKFDEKSSSSRRKFRCDSSLECYFTGHG